MVTAFTFFELLRENQLGEGVKLPIRQLVLQKASF